MTENQRNRFANDLETMSGGYKPLDIMYFEDGAWTVVFNKEIAALRVCSKYNSSTVRAVKAPNSKSWLVRREV